MSAEPTHIWNGLLSARVLDTRVVIRDGAEHQESFISIGPNGEAALAWVPSHTLTPID